eukprot:EC797330.1.p2 GENE.EC797330.1~~EC797330.1.p2  ORF type:complete len:142 (+),score=24.03 EC797330.1:42-467(+)
MMDSSNPASTASARVSHHHHRRTPAVAHFSLVPATVSVSRPMAAPTNARLVPNQPALVRVVHHQYHSPRTGVAEITPSCARSKRTLHLDLFDFWSARPSSPVPPALSSASSVSSSNHTPPPIRRQYSPVVSRIEDMLFSTC